MDERLFFNPYGFGGPFSGPGPFPPNLTPPPNILANSQNVTNNENNQINEKALKDFYENQYYYYRYLNEAMDYQIKVQDFQDRLSKGSQNKS
mgnify:CR=1 FL=1